MRYVFHSPIRYVTECVEVMMITSIFLAIAHTQDVKGHVNVDIITSKLKPRARLILEFVTTVLGLATFAVIIWQIVKEIPWVIANNMVHTQSFLVSKSPFLIVIALGCTALWLLLLRDLLVKIREARQIGMNWFYWLLAVILPAGMLVLAWIWAQPTMLQTSLTLAGGIGVLVALVLFLMGMPISFALLFTSIVFTMHIRGMDIAFNVIAADIYRTAGTYSFASVNFFVLLGFFCLFARFGEDLYFAAYKWMGHPAGEG
jgi:TRAP-type C4-dicarboxylate transport system permease small subunit